MRKHLRFVTIVGARPQFMKAAALSPHLRNIGNEVLVHTGQHYDHAMSGAFFDELSLPVPDYNLGVGSGTHAQQTALMLEKIESVLTKERPQLLIVFGDTNSTLAGALAASKLHIPIAHVEAGMRSFDRTMPEELNRIVTDHLSSLLFCPSPTAVGNLRREGIEAPITLSGDNMLDTLFQNLPRAKISSDILRRLGLVPGAFLLLTLHRASNTDTASHLRSIVDALSVFSETIVFPVHPRTKKALEGLRLWGRIARMTNVILIEPVPYLDMLLLMSSARLIMTDSGGVQKEAYALRIPCVTLRNNTEWVETVDEGWNVLAGSNIKKIRRAVRTAKRPSKHSGAYGRGTASKRIARRIKSYVGAT